MPGKSEIELMPNEVRSRADTLWAENKARCLITTQISEKNVGISAKPPVKFNATVNRIKGRVRGRHQGRGIEKRN